MAMIMNLHFCGTAAVFFNILKRKENDSRHETLHQAEGLWVFDQLWVHVGVVVHHLSGDGEYLWILNGCIGGKQQYS